jgi:glycosyltransferase involved in cell wall biosynthesis
VKIAIVNQWYPPNYGGIAAYNGYVARAYAAMGHDVTIVTARTSQDQPSVTHEGPIRIVRVEHAVEPYLARRVPLVGRYARTARHLLYSARVHRTLSQLLHSGDLDIIEFAEVNAEGFVHALRPTRIPVVVRCHTPHMLLREEGHGDDGFDMTLIGRLESATVRRASAVTAPSADLARSIEREMKLPGHSVHVIPNPVDTLEFSPRPAHVSTEESKPMTILYAGRLGREKGVFVLAEALAELARTEARTPERTPARWRAVFAGGDRGRPNVGSNRAALARFFADCGLANRVELRGAVSQEDLVSLYREADICVVPSTFYESFSYTSVQAMACGKPVVASRIGGIPEVVIDGKTGLLTQPGNVQELAGALRRLIDDGVLRASLGTAGRERAVRLYAYQIVAQQNLQLYEQVLARRQTPSEADARRVR